MFTVVYTNPDFVVLSKPAGINFHSEHGEAGFVEQAKAQLGESLWPVHRLDKATSGLLILARNKEAAAHFGVLFGERKMQKYYLALASAKPKKKQGLIKGDMEKSRGGNWKLCQSQHNPAITQFFSYSLEAGRRLFVLKPHTGRTHQLRVALKSLGAPIVGDTRYGGEQAGRLCLHAYALQFDWQGERIALCSRAELNADMALESLPAKLDELGAPWDLAYPKLA